MQHAAQQLGTTDSAIRKRISRGSLAHEKDEDGKVWVFLPDSPHRDTEGQDSVHPGGQAGQDPHTGIPSGALFEQMQERIAYLERQVEEEREARRRADTLLARMMDRLPELEPPRDAPPDTRQEDTGRTETASEGAGGTPAREDVGRTEEPTSRRSWWRRFFG